MMITPTTHISRGSCSTHTAAQGGRVMYAPLEQRRAVLARTGRTAHVEDLKHFVLECPAYDDLRAACPAFPADVRRSVRDPAAMCAVFGHPAQASLAHTLHLMRARRDDLLGAVGSN
jgi:hypothetical protein